MSMTSSVQDIDEVTKQIKVTIPVDKVASEFESALNEVGRTLRIKGFRPGKAPRSLIEKMHGKRVRAEVTQRLISSSLYDLVREHKIDMLGSPSIDVGSEMEPGKEIEYTASISVLPKPEIKGYEKFTVSVPKREVTPQRVDEEIEKLRQSRASVKKLEGRDVAQQGDVVNAEVSITLEGQEPSRPEPVIGSLGDGTLPKELEDGIVGMKLGETKEMTTKLPEDHSNTEMRGKDAHYKITLHTIYEKVLPALDDELAKSADLGAETLDELKTKMSERLAKEDERESKADAQTKVLDKLLEENDFKVPQVLVDDEIRGLVMRSGIVDPQKIDPSRIPVEPFREKLGDVATKRVKTAIIVDRIGEIESIKVEDADIESAMDEIAVANGVTKDEVRKFFLEKSRVSGFLVEISRNKVLEFLMGRTEVQPE